MKYKEAKLILKDGSEFIGKSFGYETNTNGEVVFNTGMVGYPETLTDPSYSGQILTMTYPLIGNYGVPGKKKENGLLKYFESDNIHCRGLIVSEYSKNYSHWNAERSLSDWLKEEKIPGIYGIDTRKLTKILREKGSMLGKIIFQNENIDFYDPNNADIVKEVSIKESITYNDSGDKKIILIDCGTKYNIIRSLLKRNMCVIRVPYDCNFFQFYFDGLVVSNGPGNPKMYQKTIHNLKRAMEHDIPTFGICLGNQLLALAAGGNTYKLKYGHRSQNQPCILANTKRCFITTQNHGFAVDLKSLGEEWQEYYVNANDNTNEGLRHMTKPFLSVQFHPESTPGPYDTEFLFDEFVKILK
ncbi:MAG: glutamine-hydrolyzing carbamoyl-phosphate synthase small subunit [Bacteroidetes bacterium]|nr:glutamine-hydrolyzing carbamoyl-phosphate synthase small subunit [Bacteroidota bacterium]